MLSTAFSKNQTTIKLDYYHCTQVVVNLIMSWDKFKHFVARNNTFFSVNSIISILLKGLLILKSVLEFEHSI